MANGRKDQDLESFDEIDIDSILNESIGTTGKPDVPSAHEKLPSLLEQDTVDIEALLAEINADAMEVIQDPSEAAALDKLFESHKAESADIEEFSQPTPASPVVSAPLPVLEEIDMDFDIYTPRESEAQHEAIETSQDILLSPEEEQSLDEPFLKNPSDVETVSSDENTSEENSLLSTMFSTEQSTQEKEDISEPQQNESIEDSNAIIFSQLLFCESESPSVGEGPIPEAPRTPTAQEMRRFQKSRKQKWSTIQKLSLLYVLGILLWAGMATHMYIRTTQHQEEAIQASVLVIQKKQAQVLAEKRKKQQEKQKKLAQALLIKEGSDLQKKEELQKQGKYPLLATKAEAVSSPTDLEEKNGIEKFDPVQCNLMMDSKTLKEELFRCLRMAKVID